MQKKHVFLFISFLVTVAADLAPVLPPSNMVPSSAQKHLADPEHECANLVGPSKTFCMRLFVWDNKVKVFTQNHKVSEEVVRFDPNPYALERCMSIPCMCANLTGVFTEKCSYKGKALKKIVRKEYRMMSDEERTRYHATLNILKDNGQFDKLADAHFDAWKLGGNGAHGGPAFLPWHREYLKRFEFALRLVDPDVYVPYWDSTLENRLKRNNRAKSVMYSHEFFGDTNAFHTVNNGPFVNWVVMDRRGNTTGFIQRTPGETSEYRMMEDFDIDYTMMMKDITSVLTYTTAQDRSNCPNKPQQLELEFTHGQVHMYVGGTMEPTETAANDPIFYSHHAFVDFVWEMWRQKVQGPERARTEYPPDDHNCENAVHFRNSIMMPFAPMKNIDGISNDYTNNLYEYAPRPTCSRTKPNCGSRFLFCDLSNNGAQCVSKMKAGGLCSDYSNGEEVCYEGSCIDGVCVTKTTTTTTATTTTTPKVVTTKPPVTAGKPSTSATTTSTQKTTTKSPTVSTASSTVTTTVTTTKVPTTTASKMDTATIPKKSRQTTTVVKRTTTTATTVKPTIPTTVKTTPRQETTITSKTIKSPTTTKTVPTTTTKTTTLKPSTSTTKATTTTRAPTTTTTTPTINTTFEFTDSQCYNEFSCCPIWSGLGYCTKADTKDYVKENCRRSCGLCTSPPRDVSDCVDYSSYCFLYPAANQCATNSWAVENCRKTCGHCYLNQKFLNEICLN